MTIIENEPDERNSQFDLCFTKLNMQDIHNLVNKIDDMTLSVSELVGFR